MAVEEVLDLLFRLLLICETVSVEFFPAKNLLRVENVVIESPITDIIVNLSIAYFELEPSCFFSAAGKEVDML